MVILAGCDTIDEAYAQVCHSAISGMGTDCKALIRLMVTCTPEVMNKTRDAYARLYGTDLVMAMSSEWKVGGDFKRLLCALAKKHPDNIMAEPDYAVDVKVLRDACEGLGTDEAAIIGVLSCKTNDQVEQLKEAYKVEHGELLKERVKSETTGLFESENFRNCLMGLLTNRETQIAFYLKEAFDGWFANDDWGLISMLVHRTEPEMKKIIQQYTVVHGASLIADLRVRVGAFTNPPKTVCPYLYKKGRLTSAHTRLPDCLRNTRHERLTLSFLSLNRRRHETLPHVFRGFRRSRVYENTERQRAVGELKGRRAGREARGDCGRLGAVGRYAHRVRKAASRKRREKNQRVLYARRVSKRQARALHRKRHVRELLDHGLVSANREAGEGPETVQDPVPGGENRAGA